MDDASAQQTFLPNVGAEIAGKYRLEAVLGQGGMGAVFAARNILTGKRVAIKWLLPQHAGSTTRDRLLREAQIAASIEHPNVVDIYDVGEHEGGLFLVMEYLRGPPLSAVLDDVGRMDPEPLIALLVPAMRGVHAAHQAGVIHRDLKPENILLHERDGKVVPKVVDFGVSKTVNATLLPAAALTRTGALIGTPHYMALEQIDGSKDIDSRTDVYAFGVLLYRALTGSFPYDGEALGEIILKIGTADAAPLRSLRPELPSGLEQVVMRALSRSRTKRQRDLEELARVLAPFTSHRPDEPIELSLLPRVVRSTLDAKEQSGASAQPTPLLPQRRRTRAALMGGLAMALVLLAVVFIASRRSLHRAPGPAFPEVGAAHVEAVAAPLAPPPILQAAPLAPEPLTSDAGEQQLEQALEQQPEAPSETSVAPEKKPLLRSRKHKEPVKETVKELQPVPAAAQRIPGERTKGLAADDF